MKDDLVLIRVKQPGLIAALVRFILRTFSKGGEYGHVAILSPEDHLVYCFNIKGARAQRLDLYLAEGNEILPTSYKVEYTQGMKKIADTIKNKYNVLFNIKLFLPSINVRGDNCVSWCCRVLGREELGHKEPDFFQ